MIWISRFVGYKHGECSCLLSAHVCSSFMFTVQRACKCQSVGAFFNICFSNNTMAEAPFNNYSKLLSITVLLQVFLWFMSVLVHACFQNLFFLLEHPLGDNRQSETWWDQISPTKRVKSLSLQSNVNPI